MFIHVLNSLQQEGGSWGGVDEVPGVYIGFASILVSVTLFLPTLSSEPLRLLQQNFGDMLVHHDDSDCHVKNRKCCFQGQGHSEGSTPEKVTVSPSSSVMLHLLQPNLVCWCIVRIDRHVGIRAGI